MILSLENLDFLSYLDQKTPRDQQVSFHYKPLVMRNTVVCQATLIDSLNTFSFFQKTGSQFLFELLKPSKLQNNLEKTWRFRSFEVTEELVADGRLRNVGDLRVHLLEHYRSVLFSLVISQEDALG